MTTTDQNPVRLSPSGLVIDGEERVLLCASLFYFRIPREEWAARLATVRESGYTVIDVYLPWNFHELTPGEWDFSGRRDVAAFLDLAHEAGLSVIARPGPYICSEWDGGALPAWLTLDPDLRLRQNEPAYLAAVERWLDRALPLIAARQHGAGGSVVAVQLENELDFFDTADRPSYQGMLAKTAARHGISVPLIACAGQGDPFGATGGVPEIAPALNFYPDDRSPAVEAEVRHYAGQLAQSGLPLMVTETNRAHVTLRRLLVSGATVIAPYLQASGYDFGYTPSVGNWGNPGGFMTHDYDFGGYIDPIGATRPGFTEAQVLGRVVATLGPALARGTTAPLTDGVRVDVTTSESPSRLLLDGGGELWGVPNLTDRTGTATVSTPALRRTATREVTVPLRPHSCLLVTTDLPLARFGLPGTLSLATADLARLSPDGIELCSGTTSVVALTDGVAAPVVLTLDAPAPGSPARATVISGDTAWTVIVHHPLGRSATADAGTATDAAAPPTAAPPVVESVTRLDLPTRTGTTTDHRLPPSSEAVGVYRGRTHYATELDGACELLVAGAADITDLTVDGKALPTVAGFGAAFTVPVAGAHRLMATVETWGHANFDDYRLPGLRMGSLRGLGRVWSIIGRVDVSALWQVAGLGIDPVQPAPLRTLGGWSSTRLGEPVTYARTQPVDGTSHYALRLTGIVGSVDATVDGVRHLVTEQDPWLFLSPGQAEVALTLPHRAGAGYAAELLRLEQVTGWQVEPQTDVDLQALAAAPASGTAVDLPLDLTAGQEVWLDVQVPPGGLSLRFDGRQVRVSAFIRDEMLGRVWLEDSQMPPFTGGDAGRLWLPAAWNTGAVRLLVHATAGDHTPRLAAIHLTDAEP